MKSLLYMIQGYSSDGPLTHGLTRVSLTLVVRAAVLKQIIAVAAFTCK